MKIKKLELKNFKRFTHLVIDEIPEDAKLVLLIGANGSGKSSVFDAFELANSTTRKHGREPLYYRKDKNKDVEVLITNENGKKFITGFRGSGSEFQEDSFYGRTSFRQVPRLTRNILGKMNVNFKTDSDRPSTFIDQDLRFENDIEKITGIILKEFFQTDKSKEQIKEKYIEPINYSLRNIFGNGNGTKLQLIEIIPPLEGKVAQINFKKGESEIHYDYLSAGEKEAFNILINLLSRRDLYTDTVYFFDEIDLHLNTKLQYNLLKEITENWIPENCQLWTASHSLGFIDYANDSEKAVIIDLDDLDFDKPQIIKPSDKSNYQVFELAVSKEFIDKVFQGQKVIFSENSDTPLYNDLSIGGTFFFKAIDKMDVFHKSKNLKTKGLIDRDYLTDEEIQLIRKNYPDIMILPYYSIENMLYHPDNLEEYFQSQNKPFDKQKYVSAVTLEKNTQRDYIVAGITKARDGYPFFKENEKSKDLKSFKENWSAIVDLLRNDDFETFYRVFPAKDYGTTIQERQNLNVKELAKTNWFKHHIEAVIST